MRTDKRGTRALGLLCKVMCGLAGALFLLVVGSWSAQADQPKDGQDRGLGTVVSDSSQSVAKVTDDAAKKAADVVAEPVADVADKAAPPTREKPEKASAPPVREQQTSAQGQEQPEPADPEDAPAAERQDAPAAEREDAPAAEREDAPAAEREDAPAAERTPVQHTVDTVREGVTEPTVDAVQDTVERSAAAVDSAARTADQLTQRVPAVRDVTPKQTVSDVAKRVTEPAVRIATRSDKAVDDLNRTIDNVVDSVRRPEPPVTVTVTVTVRDAMPSSGPETSDPVSKSPRSTALLGERQSAPQRRALDAPVRLVPDDGAVQSAAVALGGDTAVGQREVSVRSKWEQSPVAASTTDVLFRPTGATMSVGGSGPSTVSGPGLPDHPGGSPVPGVGPGVIGGGSSTTSGSAGGLATAADLPESVMDAPATAVQTLSRSDWRVAESPAFPPGTSPD